MKYSVGLIVVSDRASRGERVDGCLPVFRELLAETGFEIRSEVIVDDEPVSISKALNEQTAARLQLIFTSGGTGCGRRDNTPEVTRQAVDKLTPGIDEAIRMFSCKKSRFAIYSRGVSGIARESLIINLPGSPKAVGEIVSFLLPTLHHPLNLIAENIADCQEDITK